MNQHVSDILEKLKSDRLWAGVGFVLLVIVNRFYPLLDEEQLKSIMWVAITFIVGKSIRGTSVGDAIESIAGRLISAKTEKTEVVATAPAKRPEDLP